MTPELLKGAEDTVDNLMTDVKDVGEEVTGGTTTEPFGTPLADAYKGGNKRRSNKRRSNKRRSNKSRSNKWRSNKNCSNKKNCKNKTRRNKNRNNRSRR